MKTLEPKVHAWAVYPASILAAIAALVFVTENALLIGVVLIGAGAYLLTRNRSAAKSVTVSASPAQQRRAALEKWRTSLAKLESRDASEILSNAQLEALLNVPAATLEDLRGTLGSDQFARYGNQVLEILRSVA